MSYLNRRGKFVVAVVIILILLYVLSDPYGLKDTDFIGNVKENSDRMLEEAEEGTGNDMDFIGSIKENSDRMLEKAEEGNETYEE